MKVLACLLLVSVIGAAAHAAQAVTAGPGLGSSAERAFAYAAAGRQPQLAPAGQEEFVPIDELPPEDKLPAAPLLVTGYAFAWLAIFGYLWSIWRRLGHVERELSEVGRFGEDRPRT